MTDQLKHPKFEPGDVALLRGSDVFVTVERIRPNDFIEVAWFDKTNALQRDTFPASCLSKVPMP